MTSSEIQNEIIEFGYKRAFISCGNPETFILTGDVLNPLEKQLLAEHITNTESLLRNFMKQVELRAENKGLTDDYCYAIFQYVFDKVAEVTYKLLMDKEVDTEIKISEIFEYQELDLPYYIQQKINNVVLPLGFLSGNVLEYIEKKEYKKMPLNIWFFPLLFLSSAIAIQFVQEMDFSDDSELQQYINQILI